MVNKICYVRARLKQFHQIVSKYMQTDCYNLLQDDLQLQCIFFPIWFQLDTSRDSINLNKCKEEKKSI